MTRGTDAATRAAGEYVGHLTNIFFYYKLEAMVAVVEERAVAEERAVELLQEPERVAAILSPLRRRLLAELREPDSAAGLARRLGTSRQRLNYHLRELEREGLVELVRERQRRGCVERILRATARAYVIDPTLLGDWAAGGGEDRRDRFSSAYLLTRAAAVVREVAILRERARGVRRKLATATLEAEIHFESPASMRAFSQELAGCVADLVARYHRPDEAGGREHRLLVTAYPTPKEDGAGRENRTERTRRS